MVGANVKSKMLKMPRCLVIRSDPPLASSKLFAQLMDEALKAHKSELIGGASAQTTIREWTVYLLATYCEHSNRNAIQLWNSEIDNRHGCPYNMSEDSVTSPGESQFSRDKSNLETRIKHYRRYLLPLRI